MNRVSSFAAALAAGVLLPCAALAANGQAQWNGWGGGPDNARNGATESQIGPDNVGSLQLAWEFTTGVDVSATPTVHGGNVYFPDWAGNVYSLDADTGAVNWQVNLGTLTGVFGDFSRTSPAVHGNTLVIGSRAIGSANVIGLNRQTGALKWMTSLDPHPAAIITQSPTIHGSSVYVGVASLEEAFAANPNYPCCSFVGSMNKLDVNTGALQWQTKTIEDDIAGVGGFSGNAVWGSSPSIDPSRNAVYIATGNNYEAPADLENCIIAANGDAEAFQSCLDTFDPPGNHFDAILSLDMTTGAINWSKKLQDFDSWNVACIPFLIPGGDPANCPDPAGPDYDFGQAPMTWTAGGQDFVGAGQKSGIFWALDRDTGEIVWAAIPGPGGVVGGHQWGSATDGERVYTGISNYFEHTSYPLIDGTIVNGGSWSGIDAATGEILWQTADPISFDPTWWMLSSAQGPVTVANGVVYGGSTGGQAYAMDAETGAILWSYQMGGSVVGGASVVNGMVFWGSGYAGLAIPGNKIRAFALP